MSDLDPARDYEMLRGETARMLNLDLADLSPADGLRLDLTSLLRLSLDGLQGVALAGREVDLGRLQSCYGMLAKLLPQAVEAPPVPDDKSDVRQKVAALLNGIEEARLFEEAEADERLWEAQAADALSDVTPTDTKVSVEAGPPTARNHAVDAPPPPAARHYLRNDQDVFVIDGGCAGADRWRNNG